jgi:ABC-type uncharacterized transport system substrate-binding protein
MRRREFISLVGCAAAWPFSANAQQPEQMRRVGVLMARDENDPEGQKQAAALRTGLSDIGWKIGQSLQLDFRWAVGDPAKSSAAALELVALKPDLLIANATPSLAAMRPVADKIPIVFVSARWHHHRLYRRRSHHGRQVAGLSQGDCAALYQHHGHVQSGHGSLWTNVSAGDGGGGASIEGIPLHIAGA